jgi:hypothetical protein
MNSLETVATANVAQESGERKIRAKRTRVFLFANQLVQASGLKAKPEIGIRFGANLGCQELVGPRSNLQSLG